MRRCLTALAAALLLACLPAPRAARAEAVVADYNETTTAFELNLKWPRFDDLLGIGIEHAPLPWLALTAALNVGLGGYKGGAGVRLQRAVGRGAFGVELGAMAGPHRTAFWDGAVWDTAWFASAQVTAAWRFDSGVQVRAYGGLQAMLDPDGCDHGCEHVTDDDLRRPTAGFAVGYAFR